MLLTKLSMFKRNRFSFINFNKMGILNGKPKNLEDQSEMETNKCPEFPFFGATYPDATCIDGKLFDLDSYEEDGLTSGGDYSCPFCRRDEFIEEQIERGLLIEEVKSFIKYLEENYNPKK